jgi:hypothetical protein
MSFFSRIIFQNLAPNRIGALALGVGSVRPWLVVVAGFLCAGATSGFAGSGYSFSTFAGSGGTSGCIDATGLQASFLDPCGVAADSSGNFYVADTGNNVIRKISSAGVVTTVAGTPGVGGSADGIGPAASFNSPQGIAVDSVGNIYVADTYNYTIRMITPAGAVSTLAGTAGVYGATDGMGTAASFNQVSSVAVDSAGVVYVADKFNGTIRKITPAGIVTTFAGSPGSYGSANGTGGEASFSMPVGVAVDSLGNVYVADFFSYEIRKITPAGVVTRLAGQSSASGSRDGTAPLFAGPTSLAVDNLGNVYVTDGGSFNPSTLVSGDTIRKITPAGVVTTLAGAANQVGRVNGVGDAALFNDSRGIAVDPQGNLVVADANNHMIRRVTVTGLVTTFAGGVGAPDLVDANGAVARFHNPGGLVVDSAGNLLVADIGNHAIRKITPSGDVTTVESRNNFVDTPAIATDSGGNIYSVYSGCQIVKITPGGAFSILAGIGNSGNADGPAQSASFSNPHGLVADSSGNVYVADSENYTIRKVTPAGVVTTLAGVAGEEGSDDGVGDAARFSFTAGIAIDSAGYLYVADAWNSTVRKVSPAGLVTTLAGLAGSPGSADGTGSAARFLSPQGITVDAAGNVFVADNGNHTIRKITPAGGVSTIGGLAGAGNFATGVAATARFSNPTGIAVDRQGKIYVSDGTYNTIVVGKNPNLGFGSDFTGDGQPDILWQNTNTGERFIWEMNLGGHAGGVSLGMVSTDWSIVGTADFNGDGQTDILWQNTITGERYLWFMNGVGHTSGASLGIVSTDWSIAGTADFNGDGQTDILWQNSATGERYIWLMRGAGHLSDVSLGLVNTQWSIAALADFNGDGQADLLWQNIATGERYIWFMSGAGHVSDASLGVVDTAWSIASAADFNGDGHPDILWQNTITGQRYLWLMNGTARQSDVDLGFVNTNWVIVK